MYLHHGIKTNTLDEIDEQLRQRDAQKKDHVLPISHTSWQNDRLCFLNDKGNKKSVAVTSTAIRQACKIMEIPHQFFMNSLTPALRTQVYNYRMMQVDQYMDRMIRCQGDTAYGIVGDKYQRLNHSAIMKHVKESDISLMAVKSDDHFDHGVFRFIPQNFRQWLMGDTVPMVTYINSENGLASLSLNVSLFTLVCENGLMVPASELVGFTCRKIHKGDSELNFPRLSEVFGAAMEYATKLLDSERIVLSQGSKCRIHKWLSESSGALTMPVIEHVAETINNRYNGGRTLQDVVHGITYTAHGYRGEQAYIATELQRAAGKLLISGGAL